MYLLLASKDRWDRYSSWAKRREDQLSAEPTGGYHPSSGNPIVTIFLPNSEELKEQAFQTLTSISHQTLPDWEVVLVEKVPGTFPLGQFSFDARIRSINKPANSVPRVYLQDQIEKCKSDYLVLISPGTTLSPTWLASIAGILQSDPSAEVVYTDEDYLDQEDHARAVPWFKPDWSPELLFSIDFLNGAVCSREALIKTLGACRLDTSYQEAFLRTAFASSNVHHIPEVFIHRAGRGSRGLEGTLLSNPAGSSTVFDLIPNHAKISEGLAKQFIHPEARVNSSKTGEIHISVPKSDDLVSILIPTHDHAPVLERCVKSIFRNTSHGSYEIILLENNSKNPQTFKLYQNLQKDPRIRIIPYDGPFNYNRVNNLGAKAARGSLLLFLNNDVECIQPEWLDELVLWARQPEIGAVSGKLLHPDRSIQHAGVIIGMEGHGSHVFGNMPEHSRGPFGSVDWYRDYSALTGACLIVRRQAFESINGFDEDYELVFSDIDLCVRLSQAGFRNVYNPYAVLIHHEGKTRSNAIPEGDIRHGYQQLKDFIRKGDPYYNRNLSLSIRVPALAYPWEEQPLQRLEKIVEYL